MEGLKIPDALGRLGDEIQKTQNYFNHPHNLCVREQLTGTPGQCQRHSYEAMCVLPSEVSFEGRNPSASVSHWPSYIF